MNTQSPVISGSAPSSSSLVGAPQDPGLAVSRVTAHADPDPTGPAESSFEEELALRDLVRRHQVFWKVWPEYEMDADGKTPQVGFRLGLMGTHDHPEIDPLPGCRECQRVYRDLSRIARFLLPPPDRDSEYELSVFNGALAYTTSNNSERRDVVLTITVTPRPGVPHALAECQARCLHEIESRLTLLGANKNPWREARHA